jgi:hypothetical protein
MLDEGAGIGVGVGGIVPEISERTEGAEFKRVLFGRPNSRRDIDFADVPPYALCPSTVLQGHS